MASKINTSFLYRWILLAFILCVIFFVVFFLFIKVRENKQKESSFLRNGSEQKCLTLDAENLKLVPLNKEKEEEVLEYYRILEIGNLYGERKKIFINASQERICPKVNEIIFLPFQAARNESKEILISFIHCENKFPVKVWGELKIREKKYLINFATTRTIRDVSLWRGTILKIPEEKLEPNCYPVNFNVEDNLGNLFQFGYYIEIF